MINNNELQLEVFKLLIDSSNIIRDKRQIQYAKSLEDKGLITLINHKQGVSGYFNKAAVGDWVYAEIQKTEIKTIRDDTNHCRFSVSLQNNIPEPYKDPKTQKNYRNTRSIDIDIVTDGLEQDAIYNPHMPFSLLYTGIIQTEHFIQSVSHNEISGFPYKLDKDGLSIGRFNGAQYGIESSRVTSHQSVWLNRILDVLDEHRKSDSGEVFLNTSQLAAKILQKTEHVVVDIPEQITKPLIRLRKKLVRINWLNDPEMFLCTRVTEQNGSKEYKLSVSALPALRLFLGGSIKKTW
jgi:hypothetical protein